MIKGPKENLKDDDLERQETLEPSFLAIHERDEFTNLDRIDEVRLRLSKPRSYNSNGRPGIEWCIELDRLEVRLVYIEHFIRWSIGRIKISFPVPIVPTRAANKGSAH